MVDQVLESADSTLPSLLYFASPTDPVITKQREAEERALAHARSVLLEGSFLPVSGLDYMHLAQLINYLISLLCGADDK